MSDINMQTKNRMMGRQALQKAVLVAALVAVPFAQAETFYQYVGPSGEKMFTNIPRDGLKLRKQSENMEGILDGRKGRTAADLPMWVGYGSGKPSKRKWVNSSEYDAYIRTTAMSHGVEPALVKAVIQVESNFDPDATSRAGARGLMQLMPGTAARYDIANYQLSNPKNNIDAGVKHLAYLKTLFPNNMDFVLAAYNAGEKNVMKYNGIPPFPETVDYVQKVKSSHNIFKRVFF
jgi:soluble lytic murein transglycosylase-like protein